MIMCLGVLLVAYHQYLFANAAIGVREVQRRISQQKTGSVASKYEQMIRDELK